MNFSFPLSTFIFLQLAVTSSLSCQILNSKIRQTTSQSTTQKEQARGKRHEKRKYNTVAWGCCAKEQSLLRT